VSSNLPAIPNLRLFHISINFHGELDTENVQKAFSKAIDWIHYMPNCWLVLTNSDAKRWHARLAPLLGDTDTMLICQVQPDTIAGWIQNWIIKWIKESTERISKSQVSSP
jgi:hypothetical protein